MKASFFCVLSAVFGLVSSAHGQSITIDGSTVTGVATRPGGGVDITIAAPDAAGVSRNGFKTFDVDAAGAYFDNAGRGAQAIVAEVSGSTRSQINGPVQVEGDRADFVLVNPNGISVNGARFENMRGLALIAGRRSVGGGAAPLSYDISEGDIDVGAQGLVANVRRLDLAARTLSVTGPVTDEEAVPFVRMGLHAGPGTVQIDPSIFSTDDTGYFTLANRGGAQDGVSLTVSSGALLRGGRVTLRADGRGAGVVMNGEGLASVGEFMLDASGAVRLSGATARAQSAVEIRAASLETTGGSITSDTGGIDVTLSGGAGVFDSTTLSAQSMLSVTGASGLSFASLVATSVDTVQLGATDRIDLRAAQITAGGEMTVDAPSLSLNSSATSRAIFRSSNGLVTLRIPGLLASDGGLIEGQTVSLTAGSVAQKTLSETQIASIVATTGDLNATLTGDYSSESGRLLASGALNLTAGGAVRNLIARDGDPADSRSSSGSILRSKQVIRIDGGRPLAGQEIGQIGASGAVFISAGGEVENIGGNVFGSRIDIEATRVLNQLARFGQLEVKRTCLLFFCRGSVSGQLAFDGGEIETAGILRIEARESFDNVGGILRGDAGLRFSGPSLIFRPLFYSNTYARPGGLRGLFNGRAVRIYQDFEPGIVTSSFGTLEFSGTNTITIDGVPFEPGTLVDPAQITTLNAVPRGLAASNAYQIGVFADWLD